MWFDGPKRAEYYPVCHPDHATMPVLLEPLRIEQPGERHPAWLGPRAFVLAARRVHPAAKVAQEAGR
jgi:hypothetical protein